MGYECTIIFDNPKEVPDDIIRQVFDLVGQDKPFGKIGNILYDVHPERRDEWGQFENRNMIEFLLQE